MPELATIPEEVDADDAAIAAPSTMKTSPGTPARHSSRSSSPNRSRIRWRVSTAAAYTLVSESRWMYTPWLWNDAGLPAYSHARIDDMGVTHQPRPR
jgi:hypothetical protein